METLAALGEQARTCVRCRLSETRTQVVFGAGSHRAPLMIIGEAPGRDEDLNGQPFTGRSGQLLTRLLSEEMALTREQVYITNVVKCRPPENRNPRSDEIDACHPWLLEQFALIQPRVVVTLGNFASRFVLGTKEGISTLRGRVHEVGDRYVVPTFHPSAALRNSVGVLDGIRSDLRRASLVIAGDLVGAGRL